MDKKQIKKIVAEQIIGMIENNVLQECGFEQFVGWLEDGAVFDYHFSDETPMSDEEIDYAMKVARKISDMPFDAAMYYLCNDED